ncbi:tmem184A, partial [Symbiodinium sp. KB8]
MRWSLIGSAILVAAAVPSVNQVLSYIGGYFFAYVALLLPGLSHWMLNSGNLSWADTVTNAMLISLGLTSAILTTLDGDNTKRGGLSDHADGADDDDDDGNDDDDDDDGDGDDGDDDDDDDDDGDGDGDGGSGGGGSGMLAISSADGGADSMDNGDGDADASDDDVTVAAADDDGDGYHYDDDDDDDVLDSQEDDDDIYDDVDDPSDDGDAMYIMHYADDPDAKGDGALFRGTGILAASSQFRGPASVAAGLWPQAFAHVALLRSVEGAAESPQLRYLAVRCNDRPVALLPAFRPTHDVYRAELEFAEPGFAIDAVPAEGSEFANADEFSSTKLVEPGGEVRNNLDVRTSHGSGLTTYSVQIMRHSGEEVLLRDLTFPGAEESQPSFTPHHGNYTVLMPPELDRLEVNAELWDSGQSLECAGCCWSESQRLCAMECLAAACQWLCQSAAALVPARPGARPEEFVKPASDAYDAEWGPWQGADCSSSSPEHQEMTVLPDLSPTVDVLPEQSQLETKLEGWVDQQCEKCEEGSKSPASTADGTEMVCEVLSGDDHQPFDVHGEESETESEVPSSEEDQLLPPVDVIQVILNVYDVTHLEGVQWANAIFANKNAPVKLLGGFHVGVQLGNEEWAFGFNPSGSGVCRHMPRGAEHHHFRESLVMGSTTLSKHELGVMYKLLEGTWSGGDYHLLQNNCIHFAQQVCRMLKVAEPPAWLNRSPSSPFKTAFQRRAPVEICHFRAEMAAGAANPMRGFVTEGCSQELCYSTRSEHHRDSPSRPRVAAERLPLDPSDRPRFRVPWCAIKVGPFNWYCLVEGEGSEEERSTSKSARPCVGWVQVIAGVLGAVLLLFVLKLLVERKVFQIYHTEQVLGGLGAGYAVVRSGILIYRHCKRASSGLQRFALRILGVVPIFAVDAWIDLWLEGSNSGFVMLLHCIREIAEAVAVCSFVQLLLSFLGGPVQLSNSLLEQEQPPVDQLGLLQFCVPPYRPGPSFVSKVIISILQYSLVTPCLFLMTTIVWRSLKDPDLARLHRGLLHLHALPPLFKGVSCLCAMYHLVLLQRETRPHLEKFLKLNPALKFCSLHCIVFLTFWQSFAVDAVASYVRWAQSQEEHHNPQSELSRERFLESLKGLLLCLEMPSFCEIHFCAYPPDEMEEAQRNAYVVAGQSAPRRSGSGHWELEQDENVPVLLRAKDGNDQAPDVSRLMSAEDFYGSGEALQLVDLWAEVQELTDTARRDRGDECTEATSSSTQSPPVPTPAPDPPPSWPDMYKDPWFFHCLRFLLKKDGNINHINAENSEPRWTFTTAAPYWDPSFEEKLSRPEASNGESLKPRTQVVAKDALKNKGRRLLQSGETQHISVQRFFPVEVNGSRLVQIRVFPANRNTTLNRLYHIHAFRQPCPPQRAFYAPDVRLCAMTCNDGYFPRHASSRCEACPEHCARCSSYERCEVCKPSQWQTLHFLQHVGGQCHVLRIHLHELGI